MSLSNEYCIPAGTFARLCNTTRDTLRYYEQEGILIPHRDPSNHYRYYSYAQITSYYFIAIFRNLGCPVPEIHSFLLAQTPEAFAPFIHRQYQSLLQMQKELEHNLGAVSLSLLLVEKMRSCPDGNPYLTTLPTPLRMMGTTVTSTAYHARDLLTDLHLHIESSKKKEDTYTFPIGASIAKGDFLKGDYRYQRLVSFTKNTGKETILLPRKEILCFVHRSQNGDITRQYEKMAAYADSHGLTLCSDIYGISLINVVYPNDAHQYLKFVFVCVKGETR